MVEEVVGMVVGQVAQVGQVAVTAQVGQVAQVHQVAVMAQVGQVAQVHQVAVIPQAPLTVVIHRVSRRAVISLATQALPQLWRVDALPPVVRFIQAPIEVGLNRMSIIAISAAAVPLNMKARPETMNGAVIDVYSSVSSGID
jgi:hypothetical protein